MWNTSFCVLCPRPMRLKKLQSLISFVCLSELHDKTCLLKTPDLLVERQREFNQELTWKFSAYSLVQENIIQDAGRKKITYDLIYSSTL